MLASLIAASSDPRVWAASAQSTALGILAAVAVVIIGFRVVKRLLDSSPGALVMVIILGGLALVIVRDPTIAESIVVGILKAVQVM